MQKSDNFDTIYHIVTAYANPQPTENSVWIRNMSCAQLQWSCKEVAKSCKEFCFFRKKIRAPCKFANLQKTPCKSMWNFQLVEGWHMQFKFDIN